MKAQVVVTVVWMTVMMTMVKVRAEQVTKTELPDATLEVQLRQGPILANREEAGQGRYFYSVKGIPFAKPPVGDLRLKDPVAHDGWSVHRNGSFDPPFCPQETLAAYPKGEIEVTGSEDCLYLNVYTPAPSAVADLPVMVWFHGGSFMSGWSEQYEPLPLLTKDIVLVVVQYRLGILGFLSTEDSVMPGNLGLKDQTLALRWVQDNIRDLGGDPAKVTIFGESAGGAAVHYQLLTPKAKGLFSRAILQSGTALCPWALREDHKQVALRLAQHFNCSGVGPSSPALDSTQLLACLQEVPLHEFVLAPKIFAVWNNWPGVVAPRVDGDFVPDHPATLVRSGRYNKVDLITGITQHEGALAITNILSNKTALEELEQNFDVGGPLSLSFEKWDDSPLYLTRRTYYHYLEETKIREEKAEEATQMLTDRHFKMCHEETAQFHTVLGEPLGIKVFKYELQHQGERSLVDLHNSSLNKRWVSHGDDLQYLFNILPAIVPPLVRSADLFMRDIILTLWTNFATSGNPTPDGSLGFRWWPTSESQQWYLALTTSPTMKDDTPVQNMEFWKNLPTKNSKILYPERFLKN